jgi:hypothetical protein
MREKGRKPLFRVRFARNGAATNEKRSRAFAGHLLSTDWPPKDYTPSIPCPAGVPSEQWRETCFSTEVVFAAALEEMNRETPRRRVPQACVGYPGFIYFIGGRTGPIKIGFTTQVQKRLQRLSSNSPIALRVLASRPGSKADEGRLHVRFQGSRLHGEWFNRTPEILAEISKTRASA